MMINDLRHVGKLGETLNHGVQQGLMRIINLLTIPMLGIGVHQLVQYQNDKGFSWQKERTENNKVFSVEIIPKTLLIRIVQKLTDINSKLINI